MSAHSKKSQWRLWVLTALVVATGSIGFFRWAKSTDIGAGDFNAYWSASRLFLQGRNPCDRENLLEMERSHSNPDQDYAVMVWNPPTLWVFLLPVSWMPLQTARAVWLLINVTLLLLSCLILHRVYFPTRGIIPFVVYCLMVLVFAPVLIAMIAGQVTFLVLFGLAVSLLLVKRGQFFWGGAMLILTTPKPHLVVLTVPYLMLYMVIHRKWSGWLGLAASGAVCAAILSALRPNWIMDFSLIFSNPPTEWVTPTLGGMMKRYGMGSWGQWVGLVSLLLLPVFLRQPEILPIESVVGLLTLITVPITFFGWSYDQSILLIPIAQIVFWLSDPSSLRVAQWGLGGLIASVLVCNIVQRTAARSEAEYFWVPLAWAGIYALSWWFGNRNDD